MAELSMLEILRNAEEFDESNSSREKQLLPRLSFLDFMIEYYHLKLTILENYEDLVLKER